MSVEIVKDRHARPVQFWVSWAAALLTALYMLPWAIAVTRKKSNAGAVGWVNLLLGWSIIGWVVALVMACTAHQAIAVSR